MGHSAQLAVVVAALATLGLALWRALALQRLVQQRRPPGAARAAQASAVLLGYRQVFTLLIFGAISLLPAEAMVSTALGFTLVIAIGLTLLLRAFEHLFVPEVRVTRDYLDLSLCLLGATFYGWAAATSGVG